MAAASQHLHVANPQIIVQQSPYAHQEFDLLPTGWQLATIRSLIHSIPESVKHREPLPNMPRAGAMRRASTQHHANTQTVIRCCSSRENTAHDGHWGTIAQGWHSAGVAYDIEPTSWQSSSDHGPPVTRCTQRIHIGRGFDQHTRNS